MRSSADPITLRGAAAALALALASCAPAAATPVPVPQRCDLPEVIAAYLVVEWGETLRDSRLSPGGAIVRQLYASARTGTWTIVDTDARGVACHVAHGVGWTPPAPASISL